jgi:hypothetical protein
VTLVAVLAYPISFGPACWATSRSSFPHPIFEAVYLPLGWCIGTIGNSAWGVMIPYAEAGMPKDSALFVWTGSTIPSGFGRGRHPSHWEWRDPQRGLPFRVFSR